MFVAAQFSHKDLRIAYSCKLDPRIHFALVCGAKSCPPIRIYSPNNLDAGLNAAAKAFCNDTANLDVDVTNKKVGLSQIFEWYSKDFGENHQDLLKWVSQFLDDSSKTNLEALLKTEYTLSYNKYNWDLNGKTQTKL